MNFNDLKHDVAKEFGLNQRLSRRIVSYLLVRMRERLLFGEEINMHTIGCLKIKVRQPKKYINLQTGLETISKKAYVLKLEPSPKMAQELKNKTVY